MSPQLKEEGRNLLLYAKSTERSPPSYSNLLYNDTTSLLSLAAFFFFFFFSKVLCKEFI